jgi:hypothetical protein
MTDKMKDVIGTGVLIAVAMRRHRLGDFLSPCPLLTWRHSALMFAAFTMAAYRSIS